MSGTTRQKPSCDYWTYQMNKEFYEQFYNRLQCNQRVNSNNQNPIQVDSSSYPYHDSVATLSSYTNNFQHNAFNNNGNNFNNYPFQDEVKLEKDFEPNNYCMQQSNAYQVAQHFKENSMTPPPSISGPMPINKPDSSSKYNFESCQQFQFSPESTDNFLLESPPKTPYSIPNINSNNEKKIPPSESKDYNDSPTLRSLLTSGKKQLELSSTIFPTIVKNSSMQNYFEKPEYYEAPNFAGELNNISPSSTSPVIVDAAKFDKGKIEKETNTVSAASLPENMVATNLGYSPTKSSPNDPKMATEQSSVFPWMKAGSGKF